MRNNYYQKSIERLSKKALEKYQNLSEEEKDKRHQYTCERYGSLSKVEKEKKRQMVVNEIKIF